MSEPTDSRIKARRRSNAPDWIAPMTPRQRVRAAIHHQPTDRLPLDLGATQVTGIAASTLAKLRAALGLPPTPVKVHEPFQILGLVEDDLREKLGIDTIGLWNPTTSFGFRNEGWKPWQLPDGTNVQISARFEYTVDANGDTLVYPRGDRSAQPSGRLPKGGFYFDAIIRQGPLDEERLDPREYAEQFTTLSDADLEYYQKQADYLHRQTPYAVVGVFGRAALGDIAHVPGIGLTTPKGVRDPELWYEFLLTHPEYIQGIFEIHTQTALKNLKLYRQAVGDKIDVIYMSGTDFGTQRGMFISPEIFRRLWKPYYKQLNDWVHQHTPWKTFFHSCGSIAPILDDFVEMGVDIINPVQCSAEGMDPQTLKDRYAGKLVFWGGGVDTQQVLPSGTPQEVRAQVAERIKILGRGGGYVFNTIHNIQQGVPVENLLALFETVRSVRPESRA